MKDGEMILSVQGWLNFQRIDDVALTGVESMSVKDDHLCYHSAQKQGSSDFVDLIEDLDDWMSLLASRLIAFLVFFKFV